MEFKVNDGVAVNSPTLATPSSPAVHDNEFDDQPFEGLGKERLQAIKIHVRHEDTRILLTSATGEDHLPGQPRICLSSSVGHTTDNEQEDEDELLPHLRHCHSTTKLDKLVHSMKYFLVQVYDYKHIYPLHHQEAHARRIIVNENPNLHLLYNYDCIFVKPIPAYFLSASFWAFLQNADRSTYSAAIGFMRSYNYLIRYEIDYDLACEKKLIPCGTGGQQNTDHKLLVQGLPAESFPTYAEFCKFIKQFDRVRIRDVSRRYQHGEVCLRRLNMWAFLSTGKIAYFIVTPGWGVYIHTFLAPITLILGGASVVLSAMQVNLNAQEILKSNGAWALLAKASLYFPVAIIILVVIVAAVIVLGSLVFSLQESLQGRRSRRCTMGRNVPTGCV